MGERAWSRADFAGLLAAPGTVALLHDGATPDGLALGRHAADEGEILTLAVHPLARRHGVGRALIAALLARLAAAGAAQVFLEVAADNAGAQALYRGFGFEVAGRRPAYYARAGLPPADAVLMRRVA